MDIYHVIGALGVYGVEAASPREAHEKCGYKFTGIKDSLGRFEVVRQPKGVYGAQHTWSIWDNRSQSLMGGRPFFTRKQSVVGMEEFSNRVIQRETEYDFRISQGQELTSYPDGSSFWSDGTQWTCGGN